MKLRINGKMQETGRKFTADFLRDHPADTDTVMILNGFQTEENLELKEGDELYIIEKGKMPKEDELEAMMAARHTPGVHEKLKKARVAVAGLGGLGSNIACALARIGVGYLLLVDFDVVEPSNLNRQNYFMGHLGTFKTDAMREQIKAINPYVKVDTAQVRVSVSNAVSLFKNCDILCEAFDKPQMKAMLINTVMSELPDLRIVSGSGMAGYGSSNEIRTRRKLENLYICGDMESEARQGQGLMAPRVQICAGHQANMVLRLILGIENE